jgi:hypothetical protein
MIPEINKSLVVALSHNLNRNNNDRNTVWIEQAQECYAKYKIKKNFT